MCLSFVRTNATPLPGLTCWKSTMLYGSPSNWIFRPFLNSAVDTCMRSRPFPSLCLESKRLFPPLAGPTGARVAAQETQEDLRRLVHQTLLETEGTEGERGERVVGQQLPERGAGRDGPPGAQHVQERARIAVARVQTHRLLQVVDRVGQRARPAVQVPRQAMS